MCVSESVCTVCDVVSRDGRPGTGEPLSYETGFVGNVGHVEETGVLPGFIVPAPGRKDRPRDVRDARAGSSLSHGRGRGVRTRPKTPGGQTSLGV